MNYLALLVASLVAFVVGWLWYSDVLFGKLFRSEERITDADMKKAMEKGMMREMITEYVSTLISVVVFGYFMTQLALIEYREVWMLSGMVWLGFRMTAALSATAWQGKSWRSVVLSLYSFVALGCAGSVLVAWQ